MLGLKLPSDPKWVDIAKKNIEEILTDHAYCEQKAASYAISLIISFPEKKDLVLAMIDLAQEEMSHFKMVHEIILKKGYNLRIVKVNKATLSLNTPKDKRNIINFIKTSKIQQNLLKKIGIQKI